MAMSPLPDQANFTAFGSDASTRPSQRGPPGTTSLDAGGATPGLTGSLEAAPRAAVMEPRHAVNAPARASTQTCERIGPRVMVCFVTCKSQVPVAWVTCKSQVV